MTNEKNTTSRRNARTSNKSTVVEEVADLAEVSNKKAEQVVAPTKKAKLPKDALIPVMNNTTGRYGYSGRSGFSFELEEYGDIIEIPFGELQAMRSSSQKRHLEDAFIIVLDEQAVEELNYQKLYESVLDADGVEELLKNHQGMDLILSKMPLVMRESLIAIAKRKYLNGTLFDTRVIKSIETNFKVKITE